MGLASVGSDTDKTGLSLRKLDTTSPLLSIALARVSVLRTVAMMVVELLYSR